MESEIGIKTYLAAPMFYADADFITSSTRHWQLLVFQQSLKEVLQTLCLSIIQDAHIKFQ